MRVQRAAGTRRLPYIGLYLVLLGTMLALAGWQLQRAGEKERLLANAAAARQAPALPAGTVEDPVEAAKAYRRLQVVGEFLGDRQFLWDNRTHRGRAGYEVITPVRLGKGSVVLVNRGWIAPGATRKQLPDIALPKGARADYVGLFTRPSKGLMSGPALSDRPLWPKVLQYFDYAAIEAALGEPVLRGVVQLQELGRVDSAPFLYAPNWQAAGSGPDRHYGYAFQWFAMAIALTVLCIFAARAAMRTETSTRVHNETDSR